MLVGDERLEKPSVWIELSSGESKRREAGARRSLPRGLPRRVRDIIPRTMQPPVLVTGAAGFIGFHLAKRLLEAGLAVVGFDNLNDYYDPKLKQARLAQLDGLGDFTFVQGGLEDRAAVDALFSVHGFEHVVNLAAQAGVRYSAVNPYAYGDANLTGFLNVLEASRRAGVKHLLFASSSSVYGANTTMPFSVHQNVDHPLSLYAATKKANELMAHTYAHTYGLPVTGLRFFTVYGPWGRPDMAMWLFTDAILKGQPITLFNHGQMRRDFTYVDDIVTSLVKLVPMAPAGDPAWSGAHPDPGTSKAPYRIFNIGNNSPVELSHLVSTLEACLGRKAEKVLAPMMIGDVPATYADVSDLEALIGFRPSTPIEEGVARFVAWFRGYHGV
jgi:UDP-glucuronate 4-epimerase